VKLFNKKEKAEIKKISEVRRYEFASFQGIGDREQQQDSYFISRAEEGFDVDGKGLLLALADGMGGMDSGDKFSGEICNSIGNYFKNESLVSDELYDDKELIYLRRLIASIDSDVQKLKSDEELGDGGSTLCCIHFFDGEMSYLSVGDSRIYLLRDGILHRVNKIHNLGSKCLEKLEENEITWDEYRGALGKEGLTSFIGEDELSEIDIKTHIRLIPGDIIMIFSDGVFGTLTDDEIRAISVKRNVVDAAYMFEEAVSSLKKEHQDNFTGIIVRCFE